MSMICECGAKTSIVDTRLIEPQVTRRRHRCCGCGARFTTRERIEQERAANLALTQEEIYELLRLQGKVFASLGDIK